MEELLRQLEHKINQIIEQVHCLKHINHQIHQGKQMIAGEKDQLLVKQQQAISQIETLVSRLKTVENLS